MKRIISYVFYLMLAVAFICYFKICVDNWNRDAEIYNKRIKEYCPCGKWKYRTKGWSDCECPSNR